MKEKKVCYLIDETRRALVFFISNLTETIKTISIDVDILYPVKL